MTSVRSKNRDENFLYINTVQSYLGLGVFFVKSSPRAFAVKIKDQVSKQKRKEQIMEQRIVFFQSKPFDYIQLVETKSE